MLPFLARPYFSFASFSIIPSLPSHAFPPRFFHSHSLSAASSYIFPLSESSASRKCVLLSSGGRKGCVTGCAKEGLYLRQSGLAASCGEEERACL